MPCSAWLPWLAAHLAPATAPLAACLLLNKQHELAADFVRCLLTLASWHDAVR